MIKPEAFGSNQQFINVWSYIASACPKGEILEAHELVITWSGIDSLNAVFLTQPVYDEAELGAKIKVACDYAKKRSQPWWMAVAEDWVPESLRPQIDEVFARQGLVPLVRLTGMAAEQLLPTTHSSKLDCVSVNNLEIRRAVADIIAISHNLPLAPFREALELDEFWQETVFGTVGYVENQPVSTAITFLIGDKFHLGWVATLPNYRNQGYAEAVSRHSLEQAAQRYGKRRTALHATPAGFSVYQRMGYQPTAYFKIYTC